MSDAVDSQVKELIVERCFLSIAPDEIGDDADLMDEIGLDSIQILEVVVGLEETFPVDHTDRAVLQREVVRLAEKTATRLRAGGHRGRTVQLKVRYADFRTITRSRTLRIPTDLAAEIQTTAQELLDGLDVGAGIRLLGVSVHQLVADDTPLALDLDGAGGDVGDGRRAALERSIDTVRSRFGPDSVRPARLVPPPEP